MAPIVGVDVETGRTTRRWVDELEPRLPGFSVAPAAELDPGGVEIAVVGNPPGETLHRYPNLRFVQSTWAGVDALVADPPGVPIARMVSPALTEAMTEFVLMAVLMLHRGAPEYRRRQSARDWEPSLAPPATGRKVGVLGFGSLGAPAARALAGMGFDVLAWARRERGGSIPVVAGNEGLARVLAHAEILVNLLPLTADTVRILDAAAFDRMPAGAALVNVARGGHVVEDDLVAALDAGDLSDAILDVFVHEPLPPSSPLWGHPRVTAFPHVAALSDPARLADAAADNIRRFVRNESPVGLI